MAKQGKTLPARRPREMETSLFLRSAESLGRVIGSLQRQLDITSKRLASQIEGADDTAAASSNGHARRKTKKTKTTRAAAATKTKKTTGTTGTRKTKRTRAKKTTRR